MTKKHFTPQEANQTLPLVKRIVADIIVKAQDAKGLLADSPAPANRARQQKIASEMSELVAELESLGCFYKDWNFEKGLVDFPSVINGREVLLCWHSDEPDVRWYHAPEDGFAGRQLIPQHMLTHAQETVKSHTDKLSSS